MPTKVTCYLILLLRYAGSMSYFIRDGTGYHITYVPCVGFLCLQIQKIIYCINITDRRKTENSDFCNQCDRQTAVNRPTRRLEIAKTLNEMWLLINKGRVRLVISTYIFLMAVHPWWP